MYNKNIDDSMKGTLMKSTICLIALFTCSILMTVQEATAMSFPGKQPGKSMVTVNANELSLYNSVIAAKWSIKDGHLRLASVENKLNSKVIKPNSTPFTIVLGSGATVRADDMTIIGKPEIIDLKGDSTSAMQSKQFKCNCGCGCG